MTWSNEPPAVSGYWWCLSSDDPRPAVVRVAWRSSATLGVAPYPELAVCRGVGRDTLTAAANAVDDVPSTVRALVWAYLANPTDPMQAAALIDALQDAHGYGPRHDEPGLRRCLWCEQNTVPHEQTGPAVCPGCRGEDAAASQPEIR